MLSEDVRRIHVNRPPVNGWKFPLEALALALCNLLQLSPFLLVNKGGMAHRRNNPTGASVAGLVHSSWLRCNKEAFFCMLRMWSCYRFIASSVCLCSCEEVQSPSPRTMVRAAIDGVDVSIEISTQDDFIGRGTFKRLCSSAQLDIRSVVVSFLSRCSCSR